MKSDKKLLKQTKANRFAQKHLWVVDI